MSSIEEQLWSYIDGTATQSEQQAITHLIEQDEQVRLKYLELLELNNEFAAIELDEPPMAFTYNVMESIRKEQALKPLHARINKNIIRGISGFFILAILFFVVTLIGDVNWSAGSATPEVNFKLPDMPSFNGPAMQVFLYADLILGLYFINRYIRREKVAH